MARQPLEAGAIPYSTELARVLAIAGALGEAPAGGGLALRYILEIEDQRAITLPYDILALLALEIPLLVAASGLSRRGLAGADSRDATGIPGGWVPVAWFDHGAMEPGYEPGDFQRPIALCVNKRHHQRPRTGDPDICAYDDRYQDTRSSTLSALLRERLARRYASSPDDVAQWTAALAAAAGEPPRAELVADPPPPGPQRVVHATFGAGTIVRVLAGDKVEVAFDSGTRRTLKRSFMRAT